ncbi:MAG TPA: ankyrin repeat domain-containing protein [Gemmatimonadaceae bacterium]|nr:ankyrin repeat domain-containing protein [Gemmatimonadaceae bacterium]
MIQPRELRKDEPLLWSTGRGTDVWEMFRASASGDLVSVKRLLRKDPSLVRGAYAYRRPMYFAVRENQLEVAEFLLENGADPVNAWGSDTLPDVALDRGHAEMLTLLEKALARAHGAPRGEVVASAIRERDLPKVRALLDASPDLLHAADLHGNQPIHWAAMTRQLDVIDELLARGADIDAKRSDGARPVQLFNGDYSYRGWRDVPEATTTTPGEALQHLLSCGAYCDICTAAHTENVDRVRELIDEDPSRVNRLDDYVSGYLGSGSPLRNAAARGHLEIVKLLLERGADPNLPEEGIAPRGGALYSAVYGRHFEVATLLLASGADPNAELESSGDVLSIALMNGDQSMIELLCSHGAARRLHLLAYYGDLQTAAAVLAVNPELADDEEAFRNAADEGHDAFVRLMLLYEPDLAKRVTVAAKTRELTEYLFEQGMDPNRPNWLGVTALHHLARSRDVEMAELFIDHGADLHARDEDICSTPLGVGAKYGNVAMVELFLRRGAKPNLPDDPPWATPLAWAKRRGHADVVALLQQHGAK